MSNASVLEQIKAADPRRGAYTAEPNARTQATAYALSVLETMAVGETPIRPGETAAECAQRHLNNMLNLHYIAPVRRG